MRFAMKTCGSLGVVAAIGLAMLGADPTAQIRMSRCRSRSAVHGGLSTGYPHMCRTRGYSAAPPEVVRGQLR